MVIKGAVAFSNLKEKETYLGHPGTKYSLVVVLDAPSAEGLKEKGVELKEYKGNPQKKLVTYKEIPVIDTSDAPFEGEIPRHSKVNAIVTIAKNRTGVLTPYLEAVRVVELPQTSTGVFEEGF